MDTNTKISNIKKLLNPSDLFIKFKKLIKDAYETYPQKTIISLLGVILFLLLVLIGFVFYNSTVGAQNTLTFYGAPFQKINDTDIPTVTVVPESLNEAEKVNPEYYPKFSKPAKFGKFTVERIYIDKPGYFGDKGLKSFIRLGEEIVKVIDIYPDCTKTQFIVPDPVVTAGGTKVYYVDHDNPAKVIEIDTNKNERVYFVAPDPYKYIAAILISSKNELAYTLLQDPPAASIFCPEREESDYVPSKSAFYINTKVLPYQIPDGTTPLPYWEVISNVGDNYFLTEYEFIHGVGGSAQSVSLRRLSDGVLVSKYDGASVVHGLNNYAIVEFGRGDAVPGNNLIKIDLKSGDVSYIISNKWILDIKVESDNKLIITYGEGNWIERDFTRGFTGERKVLVYQL